MAKLSEHDIEQLREIFDAFGLGHAATSGHLGTVPFDNEELSEAANNVSEGMHTIQRIYSENV